MDPSHAPVLTRRRFVQGAAGAGLALSLPPLRGGPLGASGTAAATLPGNTASDYWAFADAVSPHFDRFWSDARGHYVVPGGGETSINADLLYVHAAAAQAGRTGAARNDARARRLAMRLLENPPCRVPAGAGRAAALARAVACPPTASSAGDQTHDWGWGATMGGTGGQHVVIDTAVVRALAMVYIARRELGLTAAQAEHVREHVARRRLQHLLLLSRAAPEPDQLVYRDLRGSSGRHGGRAPAAQRLPAPAQPVRTRADPCRPAMEDPVHRTGLSLPLPPAVLRPAPAQPRQRRIRHDRVAGGDVLRARPKGRHACARLRRGVRDPGVAGTGAVRLLDARRLPQLGHRALLRPLASGQETRSVPQLADAIALAGRLQPSERYGRWAKHMFDRAPAL